MTDAGFECRAFSDLTPFQQDLVVELFGPDLREVEIEFKYTAWMYNPNTASGFGRWVQVSP